MRRSRRADEDIDIAEVRLPSSKWIALPFIACARAAAASYERLATKIERTPRDLSAPGGHLTRLPRAEDHHVALLEFAENPLREINSDGPDETEPRVMFVLVRTLLATLKARWKSLFRCLEVAPASCALA
jgi:hypothetical protein